MIAIMSHRIMDLLGAAGGRERRLRAGQYLFHVGEPVAALHVVQDGEIDLIRHQEGGGAIVLQRAGANDILAEASLFSDRYHCDAIARTPASVRSVLKRPLVRRLRDDPEFAEAWAAHLAREVQSARFRSEVLSLRTVASRLDAWLAWHGAMPPRGDWKQLAFQIGVSPEALYREIARRRD